MKRREQVDHAYGPVGLILEVEQDFGAILSPMPGSKLPRPDLSVFVCQQKPLASGKLQPNVPLLPDLLQQFFFRGTGQRHCIKGNLHPFNPVEAYIQPCQHIVD